MKKLLIALTALMSVSAFAADSGSIQGRIARYTIDNTQEASNGLSVIRITIKDVCPIFPGLSYTVSKLSDRVALLEFSLLEHATCGNRRSEMTFAAPVDVRYELASVGLDPNQAQLVITLK